MKKISLSSSPFTFFCFLVLLITFFISNTSVLAKKAKKNRANTAVKTQVIKVRPVKSQAVPIKGMPQIFTENQKREIQNIIRSYLVQNPKILLEMSQSLQKVREQELLTMQGETKTLVGKHVNEVVSKKNIITGNVNGDVVLVEIFDYQCGHCKSMKSVLSKLLVSDSKLAVHYMVWPIFGPSSIYAAKAVLAARNQGKALVLHDALLTAEGPLSRDKILQIAKSAGLKIDQLKKDIDDKSIGDLIKTNALLAQKLKLVATPAFIFSNPSKNKFDFVLGQMGEDDLQKVISKLRH